MSLHHLVKLEMLIAHMLHTIFTALHAMQTWSSDEISVCLSIHLSVCQTRAL